MNNKVKAYHSSKSVEWYTPHDFYDKLNLEFNFNLDPCATDNNHKCDLYYTKEQDGLKQDWTGKRVFMNPPYGRGIEKWMEKIATSDIELGVALIPVRCETRWFHNWVIDKAEIRFIKGRLKFGGSKSGAPFASMLAIYRKPN